MLQELRVKNYALIRNLVFRPEEGLNVITGETGAGKSILLGALGLILGNRADQSALLAQDEKCVVEGLFLLENESLKSWFDSEDLDWDRHLVLRREVIPGGKSRSFINDTPVGLQQMRILGEALVEIQTQHAIINLQDAAKQRQLLDDFCGNQQLLSEYQALFRRYRQAVEHKEALSQQKASWLKERDFLLFQFQELEQFQPAPEEETTLEAQISSLSHSTEIARIAWEAGDLLDQPEDGLLQRLSKLKNILKNGAKYEPLLAGINEQVDRVYLELREISGALSGLSEQEPVSPELLEALHERHFKLQALLKKHNKVSAEELYMLKDELAGQLQEGDTLSELIAQEEENCAQLRMEVDRLAAILSEQRRLAQKIFTEQVNEVLSELEMQDASLAVLIESLPQAGIFGTDQVQFQFRSSSTLPFQPLGRIASGGELSRLMFAIQCISSKKAKMPLLVFDEADSGVSGEVALKFGRLLRQMAKNQQLIAITHLPQVAGAGHVHFYVFKEKSGNQPGSGVKKLSEADRVEELAVMMSGKNPGNSARLHAMNLLKMAGEPLQ